MCACIIETIISIRFSTLTLSLHSIKTTRIPSEISLVLYAGLYLRGHCSLSPVIGHLNCSQLFVIKKLWWPSVYRVLKTLSEWAFTQIFDWSSDYFFRIKPYKWKYWVKCMKNFKFLIYVAKQLSRKLTAMYTPSSRIRGWSSYCPLERKMITNLEIKQGEEFMYIFFVYVLSFYNIPGRWQAHSRIIHLVNVSLLDSAI